MNNKQNFISPQDLPTHKFFISFNLIWDNDIYDRKKKEIYHRLRPVISAYYYESLALLSSYNKFFSVVEGEEKELDEDYKSFLAIHETGKVIDKEYADMLMSRFKQRQRDIYIDIDLEKNQTALGTIIQFLSLLESTLHSTYKIIDELEDNSPSIDNICNRDKGIIKYLKYFERTLTLSTIKEPIIVGTELYQEILLWIKIRNNIVHNNNEVNENINQTLKTNNIEVDTFRNKYFYSRTTIYDLADICGNTLNLLIEKELEPYLMTFGLNINKQ